MLLSLCQFMLSVVSILSACFVFAGVTLLFLLSVVIVLPANLPSTGIN